MEFIGEAGARIHPSTILLANNSKIIVENGILSIGYLSYLLCWNVRDNCRISLYNSTLHIIGNVDLRPGLSVWAMNSKVVIHDGTVINGPTGIVSKAGVEIGAHYLISAGVQILDCDLHKHAVAGEEPKDIAKPVIIKDRCWIGLRASILKGVIVGEGAMIGEGSVVTKNVDERTMVAGVPARKIRDNIIWEP
ncbi:MAG TPA: acyltransferase [Dehalococcoidia bacterium]|nr:acyltransferase [Dehalococcoidia bacterium]